MSIHNYILVFHHPPKAGTKQLCALTHLGCTREVVTYFLDRYIMMFSCMPVTTSSMVAMANLIHKTLTNALDGFTLNISESANVHSCQFLTAATVSFQCTGFRISSHSWCYYFSSNNVHAYVVGYLSKHLLNKVTVEKISHITSTYFETWNMYVLTPVKMKIIF